jgi:hypothetical protein
MAKVAVQKEALGTKPKVTWKTNGIFKYDDKSNFFNINTVQSGAPLVEALAYMLNKERAVVDASNRLGVAVPNVDFGGYAVCEWEEDFKMRLSVLSWEAKKTQLDATQAKLSQLVSEEARTEMELENIAKSLGG